MPLKMTSFRNLWSEEEDSTLRREVAKQGKLPAAAFVVDKDKLTDGIVANSNREGRSKGLARSCCNTSW